jgi:hypothetical protein
VSRSIHCHLPNKNVCSFDVVLYIKWQATMSFLGFIVGAGLIGDTSAYVGDKFHSTRSKEEIDIYQLLQENQVSVISVN